MYHANMFERFIADRLKIALTDTPSILIVGPRRAGKTTLTKMMEAPSRTYITLDDKAMLESARFDPAGFIRHLDTVTIDEVQRAPELLLAIKKSIDEDYRPGRFLLTGSANVLTLPKVADSLAGRMETFYLLPLAQGEILGGSNTFIELLFEQTYYKPSRTVVGDDLIEMILKGGYPEVLARSSESRRQDWGHAYVDAMLNRDLIEIATIEKLTTLPPFVRLLAQHAGQLVNYSSLGSAVGLSNKTCQRFVTLLERIFLVTTLSPWYTNPIKRLVKTPKLYFFDSGLLATLQGLTLQRLQKDRRLLGPLLETFIFSELYKIISNASPHVRLYHYRDHQQHEVDFVLERDDGALIGLEAKASATVTAADFRGLHSLAKTVGEKFLGVVLYDGENIVPFGERMVALPISSLWQ